MTRSRVNATRAAVVLALGVVANQAQADCTFGGSGEPSLQGSLDSLLSGNAPDVVTACVADGADEAWQTVGSTGLIVINVELAGNARSNEFGVYDINTGQTSRIFEGTDAAGASATLILAQRPNGEWRVRYREDGESNWTPLDLTTSAFGFYLRSTVQGVNFYSDTARNSDGADHMYAYQGNGAEFAQGAFEGDVFGLQDYIIAWDDLLAPGADRDFQDFVAVLRDITPVPLPTAAWLLASGLIGLAGVARRRN